MTTEEYRSVAGIVVFRNPLANVSEEEENDVQSLTRKPKEKLYLLVKKPRKDFAWQFPQGGIKRKTKETVVQGALRELSEECSSDLKVELIDNDTFCIYQYPFTAEFIAKKAKKKQFPGAKVQFVRSEWKSGQCQPDGKEIIDFAWLTHEEIISYTNKQYYEGVKAIFEGFY